MEQVTAGTVLWQDRLEAKGGVYRVDVLVPDCEGVIAQVRVAKEESGDVYDVAMLEDGRCDCSCPDFVWRQKSGRGDGVCKHIRMCLDAGALRPMPRPDWEAGVIFQVVALGGNSEEEFGKLEGKFGPRYVAVVRRACEELMDRIEGGDW